MEVFATRSRKTSKTLSIVSLCICCCFLRSYAEALCVMCMYVYTWRASILYIYIHSMKKYTRCHSGGQLKYRPYLSSVAGICQLGLGGHRPGLITSPVFAGKRFVRRNLVIIRGGQDFMRNFWSKHARGCSRNNSIDPDFPSVSLIWIRDSDPSLLVHHK